MRIRSPSSRRRSGKVKRWAASPSCTRTLTWSWFARCWQGPSEEGASGLAQRIGDAPPLLARILVRVSREQLEAYVVGTGGQVLVHSADHRGFVAPDDDRVEQPVTHRRTSSAEKPSLRMLFA